MTSTERIAQLRAALDREPPPAIRRTLQSQLSKLLRSSVESTAVQEQRALRPPRKLPVFDPTDPLAPHTRREGEISIAVWPVRGDTRDMYERRTYPTGAYVIYRVTPTFEYSIAQTFTPIAA